MTKQNYPVAIGFFEIDDSTSRVQSNIHAVVIAASSPAEAKGLGYELLEKLYPSIKTRGRIDRHVVVGVADQIITDVSECSLKNKA